MNIEDKEAQLMQAGHDATFAREDILYGSRVFLIQEFPGTYWDPRMFTSS